MISLWTRTLFCGAALLTATVSTEAMPTHRVGEFTFHFGNQPFHFSYPSEVELLAGPELILSQVGREICERHDFCRVSNSLCTQTAQSLPGIPGGVFMALAGFLCVSFVRDHKAWWAGLCMIILAGQSSVHAVPQLLRGLGQACERKQHFHEQRLRLLSSGKTVRVRCELEGTRYISLLRYLEGIPRDDWAFITARLECNINIIRDSVSLYVKHIYRPVGPGVVQGFDADLQASGFICKNTLVKCFSPAFIFDNLARGPPPYSREQCINPCERV